MKDFVMKYFGLLTSLSGVVMMVASAYFPSPYLQLETFGISLGILVVGLLMFFLGAMIMAKYDEEFMERVVDRFGKIMEFI